LIPREPTDIPDAVTSFRQPKPFDHPKIEDSLKKLLEIIPPISQSEASRRLGYNKSDLHRKFPELCRKVASQYRDYMKLRCKAKRNELEEEVKQAVIQLHGQGIYAYVSLVAELLNKPSYIGRRNVAAIIYRTRESLTQQKTSS
jgi:hypothetical protein